MSGLRVCVDARLVDGRAGGVQQFVIGLASGFSSLSDGDEEYLFLTYGDSEDWIRPHVSGPCQLLTGPCLGGGALARRFAGLCSDRPIRSMGIDVVHFTQQLAFRTRIPSLYHPHDIQHIHMPEFFSFGKRVARRVLYSYFCRQAVLVPVVSSWMRREFIEHLRLPEDKVCVVPLAPPVTAYPVPNDSDIKRTITGFALPESFVFYPAQTWIHKNHIALIRALARLRDCEGLRIPFVSSGKLCDEHYADIRACVDKLKIEDQVRFLGFVSPLELQCLYRLARGVVIPTLYEAASFPLWEAFSAGTPVACSNVTSLPDIAGAAALIFDPGDIGAIACAVARLWTDGKLRSELVARGRESVSRLSWSRTSRIFRAHYRMIAGMPLSEEDASLLELPVPYEQSVCPSR